MLLTFRCSNIRCHWHVMSFCLLFSLLLQMTTAAKYRGSNRIPVGDTCEMKSGSGICTLASQCDAIERAVLSGELSVYDVVHCGYSGNEETICCPVRKREISTTSSLPPLTDRFIFENTTRKDFWSDLLTTTTTQKPDFWLDLLTTTTKKPDFWLDLLTTTTKKPDFWLDLLEPEQTTTTTMRPLMVDGTPVDTNSGFIDFSQLLTRQPAQNAEETNSNIGNNNNRPSPNGNLVNINPNDRNFGRIEEQQNIPNTFNNGQRNHNNNNWNNQFRGNQGWAGTSNNANERNHPRFINQGQSWQNGRRNGQFPMMIHNNNQPQQFVNGQPLQQQITNSNGNGRWFGRNKNVEVFIGDSDTFLQNNRQPHGQIFPTHSNIIASGSLPNHPIFPSEMQTSTSNRDPIQQINQNLINSGLNIVKANVDSSDRSWDRHRENIPITTTVATITDPFELFQFRPEPVNVENGSGRRLPGAGIDNAFQVEKSSSPAPPLTGNLNDRPAVRACKRLDEGLVPLLTPHILGGTPARLGQYPHMAAIGFTSSINDNNDGPYDYNCGGTLIDSKYVLTAAHCVNKRDLRPVVVRLGIVNFTDPDQLRHAVEIPIKAVHIHADYGGGTVYNDIAILELERDVQYSDDIYPTCLYTETADPTPNLPLFVTGWGTINTSTRQQSNVLLQARLNIVPIENCNETYNEEGFTRQIRDGISETQLCAYDPGLIKDACQGDSGGPLNLVVDESIKQYRVVGIISTGFSCGGRIPGLYTRVAAYLDFIESIVWP